MKVSVVYSTESFPTNAAIQRAHDVINAIGPIFNDLFSADILEIRIAPLAAATSAAPADASSTQEPTP